MKSFVTWLEEQGDMPLGGNIIDNDMDQPDERKINSYVHVAKRVAEKYPNKLLDSLWRIARDTDDDELNDLLIQVDNKRRPDKKHGFGMDDEDSDNGIDDKVVPNSADHGMGDSGIDD